MKLKSYGYGELAQLYFPNSSPHSATNQLHRWLAMPPLCDRLAEVGFRKGQRLLTPRQVQVIFDELGEPI